MTTNGRRYGAPWSQGSSARHLAVRDPKGGYGAYRTLCGRRWDAAEEEVGGGVELIESGRKITCKRCRARLETA